MKHTFFLVHGMGLRDPATWPGDIRQKLIDVSLRYSFFRDHDLNDFADFVPINYDDLIRDIQQQWQATAGPASAFASAQELDGAGSLDWLDGIADEDSGFFWTHVADVIIYRLFKLYRTAIRVKVMDEFATALNERMAADGSVEASVLAHSLGTAVAHDSLHRLSAPRIGGVDNALAPPHFRFKAVFFLANLSRILQSDIKAYESRLRPGSYCSTYYNCRHALDPATMVRAFEPDTFGPNYYDKSVDHLRDWNLHAFEHYLDHPRVHLPILNTIRSGAIPRSEMRDALRGANYPRFGGPFATLDTLGDHLRRLGELKADLDEAAGLREHIEVLRRGWRVLEEIENVMGDGGPQ